MQLTPQQIRSSLRGLAEWPEGEAGDVLACAVCLRLALIPDVRWSKIEEVRARLLLDGPPSPAVLAEVLVGELRLPVAS